MLVIAAGFPEPAQDLERELHRMREELAHAHQPHHPETEAHDRAMVEIREMRAQIEEVRHAVNQVREQLEELRRQRR